MLSAGQTAAASAALSLISCCPCQSHRICSAPERGFQWIIGLIISASTHRIHPLQHYCVPYTGFKAHLFLLRLQEVPGPCCPPFPPSLLLFPSPSFLSSHSLNCSFHNFLHPAGALRNEKRGDVDKNKHRECKVYLCLPPDSFFSLLLVSAAFVLKWRPLWPLLHTAGADIFLLWNVHSVCHTGKMEYSAVCPHYLVASTFLKILPLLWNMLEYIFWVFLRWLLLPLLEAFYQIIYWPLQFDRENALSLSLISLKHSIKLYNKYIVL